MKQHPVDDLFARRLNEHDTKPKNATWDEMQKRLHPQPERRIGGRWWFAAAASVAVLLLAGWWVWQQETSTPLGTTGQPLAQEKTEKQPLPPAASSGPQTVEQDSPVTDAAPENRMLAQTPGKAKSPEVALEEKPQPLSLPEAEREQVALNEETTRPAEPAVPTLKSSEPASTALVTRPAEKTLVVKIDEPVVAFVEEQSVEPVAQTPKKRIRVGRLLRQLNNLREGEPVDWQETGLNGSTILAKATETVEHGKERIAESYEHIRTKAFNRQENNK
ncbi:hypothetical protein [Tellurirhabdus rosea]|uniref:hypothetical protein n=1 Tax=Tellurirhabdus rosea TaxID=2674997 RepID=UPI00224F2216|nr:hypothetical protein [Tellurirhabdus rosea]